MSEPAVQPKTPPSTAGMTTKVVKGSLWTLAGQVAPLAVSLVTTPFTIRLLGAEGYGVFILIGLIPTYLGFADFGMSMASTKFGSEAYAEGDEEKEARIVRTAALIALMTSVPVAAALMIFAPQLIGLFNVPEALRAEAATALRIAAVTFVINFLCGIFNTPQLARLRMDMNMAINAWSRIAALIATPVVIYLGYGLTGAITVLLIASVMNLAGHLVVSYRLLPSLGASSIQRPALRPMLKFGGALVASGIAGVLLANVEKGVLAATVSTEALAYYSVGFTLGLMAAMLSSAMIQSLIPAFSQLLSPGKITEFEALFIRSLTLNLIGLIPAIIFLLVIARPFFSAWAGEDFGRESTMPFYILLVGLAVNIPAYIPYSVLMTLGKTDVIAKLYWAELFPYLMLVFVLTSYYGIIGAAAAWSVRMTIDGIIFYWLAKKESKANLTFVRDGNYYIVFSPVLFLPVILAAFVFGLDLIWVLATYVICCGAYTLLVWHKTLSEDERVWLTGRVLTRMSNNAD